jgi:hypothetical protein
MAYCGASTLTLTTATDRSSYAPGMAVQISSRVRNTSASPCHYFERGCSQTAKVTDGSGTVVWYSDPQGGPCPAIMHDRMLGPGQSMTYSFTWNQARCTAYPCSGGQVSPGGYIAFGLYRDWGTATGASFSIT